MTALLMSSTAPRTGSTFAEHYPMWGKGDPVVYWASGGRVHCRDQRPNTPDDRRFNSIHWREMAERVLEFSQMVVTYSADGAADAKLWQHERERAQRWICAMEDVLREAKEQCSRAEDAAYVADRKAAAASRVQSGDNQLAQAGTKISGDPIQKRVILPEGMGF